MSGIEVVGLVLGAFPLVISAMEHYEDIKGPTAIWWKIRRAHRKDCNRVKECELAYTLQLELLLYPLLDDHVVDQQQYQQLLSEPGGPGWRVAHVEEAIADRLSSRHGPYMLLLAELGEAMDKLCKATRVDDPQFQRLLGEEKAQPVPADATAAARTLLKSRANVAYQAKRLDYSFAKLRRTELLEEVEGCIRRLKDLLVASKELSDLTRTRQSMPKRPVAKKLLTFWKHADRIFRLLRETWCCNCRSTAYLWLRQYRPADMEGLNLQLPLCHGTQAMQVTRRPPTLQLAVASQSTRATPPSVSDKLTMTTMMHSVHATAALPLRPRMNPSITLSTSTAINLCKAFASSNANNACVCLLHEGDDEYSIYASAQNPSGNVTSITSLSDTLQPRADISLSRMQRYEIALTLVYAHLQLHPSPWLRRVWASESVQLPTSTDTADSRAIVGEPYVLADFKPDIGPLPRKDSSFLALGIVLLELCFGTRFADHKLWQKYPTQEGDPLIRQGIAHAWAEQVEDEGGEDYSIAVQWVLKQAPTELKDDKWRADFAENVVQPLQRCYESMKPRR